MMETTAKEQQSKAFNKQDTTLTPTARFILTMLVTAFPGEFLPAGG